jgi:uroporphyrinogen decarboxylase
MADVGGDLLGVDHRVSLDVAWKEIGFDRGIQGNLDATRLIAGWEPTLSAAREVLQRANGRTGHVFNLGHGVLPDTDPDLLRRLAALVHEETSA